VDSPSAGFSKASAQRLRKQQRPQKRRRRQQQMRVQSLAPQVPDCLLPRQQHAHLVACIIQGPLLWSTSL
jgi:hypothetical protein